MSFGAPDVAYEEIERALFGDVQDRGLPELLAEIRRLKAIAKLVNE